MEILGEISNVSAVKGDIILVAGTRLRIVANDTEDYRNGGSYFNLERHDESSFKIVKEKRHYDKILPVDIPNTEKVGYINPKCLPDYVEPCNLPEEVRKIIDAGDFGCRKQSVEKLVEGIFRAVGK